MPAAPTHNSATKDPSTQTIQRAVQAGLADKRAKHAKLTQKMKDHMSQLHSQLVTSKAQLTQKEMQMNRQDQEMAALATQDRNNRVSSYAAPWSARDQLQQQYPTVPTTFTTTFEVPVLPRSTESQVSMELTAEALACAEIKNTVPRQHQ